jgi:hypothetical protein
MTRSGITSLSYFPLSVANPKEAPSLIDKLAKDIGMMEQNGELAPGQAEQFAIQLETLRDDTLPDCEIIGFPGLYAVHRCECLSLLYGACHL